MPIILATQETDQEDWSSKPAQANSSWDPISKKPNIRKGWRVGSSSKSACLAKYETVSSNPSATKKKEKVKKIPT
jgi:hypothetical protein